MSLFSDAEDAEDLAAYRAADHRRVTRQDRDRRVVEALEAYQQALHKEATWDMRFSYDSPEGVTKSRIASYLRQILDDA